ncbi:putative MAM domain-containing glycosylphosphatidylinositol anchor protein 2-like [Apostichopus japonicus]|uniref:Putative MAM domain-containing glycosylphosphatidylinositol anchor protein 2-like n=1 Tax=Stichopus japonicus TaxID=307972 RepID=A0A2G8K2G5_STIJA|nr:putative MAM domain-containing glycosylphosphatidylinositol anchor protein 2-like [Apostichopus japonicus]
MYGTDVGILNVFVIVKGRKPPKPQWRKTGDKGNQWKLGEVTIPSNSTARIVFEAVPTKRVAGDIAIDEVTFTDMAIDCDFEGEVTHPSCTFIQARDDQFDWMQNSGKTPTKKTGPPVDHTRGTSKGVYMYLESTGPMRGTHVFSSLPDIRRKLHHVP